MLTAGTASLNLMQSFDLGLKAAPAPHGIQMRRTRRPRLTHEQVVALYTGRSGPQPPMSAAIPSQMRSGSGVGVLAAQAATRIVTLTASTRAASRGRRPSKGETDRMRTVRDNGRNRTAHSCGCIEDTRPTTTSRSGNGDRDARATAWMSPCSDRCLAVRSSRPPRYRCCAASEMGEMPYDHNGRSDILGMHSA